MTTTTHYAAIDATDPISGAIYGVGTTPEAAISQAIEPGSPCVTHDGEEMEEGHTAADHFRVVPWYRCRLRVRQPVWRCSVPDGYGPVRFSPRRVPPLGGGVTACTGPSCSNPPRALGLCEGHYQQQRRGQSLTPLRTQGEPLERVSLRVPAPVRERVLADPAGARATLERWARR